MTDNLRVITVLQPYASAIVHAQGNGAKAVENRTWITPHRGPLVIHAGTKTHPDGPADRRVARLHLPEDLPRGALIGVVDLVGIDRCGHPRCSPWRRRGYFHWQLTNPRALAAPIPWRGAQGLWQLHDDRDAAAVGPLRALLQGGSGESVQ